MIEERKLSALHVGMYVVIFFAVWSVKELIIEPLWLNRLDSVTWQISETLIKLSVWAVPAVLLIKRFRDDMRVSLKEMFTNKPRLFKTAPILLLVFFPLINALFIHGEIAIRPNFQPAGIAWLVFGSAIEEIVFRGFLLNTMLKRIKTWQAVMIDAVLFALIHYPIWIYSGLDFLAILSNSVMILPVSVLFAFSFIKTKNILVPMAIHILWNLLGTLFVA